MTAESKCVWTEDTDGLWETDCGKLWQLTDGTPSENEMKYCPFCGEVLVEFAPGEEE